MEELFWIDRQTRFLVVSFTVYNAHINMWAQVDLM